MKIGIGFVNAKDSFYSGKQIASQALENGNIQHPTLALAFCHNNINAAQLLEGIQGVLGKEVPVVGGSALGIITNDVISYEEYQSGLLLIENQNIDLQIACAEGLDLGEEQVGRALAEKLSVEDGDTVLMFYDSVKKPPEGGAPPAINSSVPLLKGMHEVLGDSALIVGAGTVGDYEFSNTIQFDGESVRTQSAVAVMLRNGVQVDNKIMHGCSPKDGIYHTITKIDGPVLMELDNRPVVDVINEMYGGDDWQKQLPVKRLAISKNLGDKFSLEYIESNYTNRLIMGVLPDKSGVLLFESDYEVGTEILFMLRDSNMMVESARQNTASILTELHNSDKKPSFGFYIDCAGRSALFSETLTEEAEEVQKLFNQQGTPLFGFYSGVEIAPLLNKSCGLDWTGVLSVFSEQR
jgi:hypothetical protein